MTDHAEILRNVAPYIGQNTSRRVLDAADYIERLEAERDNALQDLHHVKKHLASAEAYVERLEDMVLRLSASKAEAERKETP